MSIDQNMQATHERARDRIGQPVTFQRLSGAAPNVSVFSAEVIAVVRNYSPDSTDPSREGYSSGSIGGITQGDRQIIVLVADLAAKRFPLPVQKRDKIILVSGERLDVSSVDAEKRRVAGAIEVMASGVQ